MSRTENAAALLRELYPNRTFRLLGAGQKFVVFTDEEKIYKLSAIQDSDLRHKELLQKIKANQEKFNSSDFVYPIERIVEGEDYFVLISPYYEDWAPCTHLEKEEIQAFLVECWRKKLIFLDVAPYNFVRVRGKLKWIDYEADAYSDNLFLNMIARSFIYVKYSGADQDFIIKLRRSTINNFDLPELQGLQAFANEVFAKIIYSESTEQAQKGSPLTLSHITGIGEMSEIVNPGTYRLDYRDDFNPERHFWELIRKNLFLESLHHEGLTLDAQNYFSPNKLIVQVREIVPPKEKVSLIIKASVQDAEIIYQAAKHIIRQLSFPNSFDEKILALDIRTSNFLREYNPNSTWADLTREAQRLIDESIIDKVIFPSREDILRTNKKWFGLETEATHTLEGVPVTAQLYAFEATRNDLVLQMDCDVMIGRLDIEHSFLDDMITCMEEHPEVLSVGFNIYKGKDPSFTSYYGFEKGGFVPEVRFCLLRKSRIERLLPLNNQIIEGSFEKSWYRALEQRQKETHTCSVRGGDSRSFYIHPENFKKVDKDVWFTMVDRVEKNEVPDVQVGEFDLAGSYYDWTIPKRNEELVLVSCFRNIPFSRFLRYWHSVISQTYQDWGLILIDDASENGLNHFIRDLIRPFKDKVTFIENRFRVGRAKNIYKAIHYFMGNPQSIVCILDGDDALIGKDVLNNIIKKYRIEGCDVVIGKMYRTDKIQAHYKYTPNFLNPRLNGGNVWQHLHTFKKYLFDSLSLSDLTIRTINPPTDPLLARRLSTNMVFPEYCSDFSYMVPIVEMSQNPDFMYDFNVLHDRTTPNTPEIKQMKEKIISEILNKPRKNPNHVFIGRKTFKPNLEQIEIDITYECNLKCLNCNRSSTQAPTKEAMTMEQIKQFVYESIELGKKWKLINILGGEPTLHENFMEIVTFILQEYIEKHSPDTILQITSNGFGKEVIEKLDKLPKHKNLVIDYLSFKEDRIVSYFTPFNDAPIDRPDGQEKPYHKGCWVASYCGIGLNHLGYYPCGVAAGIDRIFGFNLGIPSLKEVDENIAQLLDTFCRYCGNFLHYEQNFGDFIPRNEKSSLKRPIISESWKKAYAEYNKRKKK